MNNKIIFNILNVRFKNSSFYKSFRSYWRLLEKRTANARHLMLRQIDVIQWKIKHSYVIKTNEITTRSHLKSQESASYIKQYLVNAIGINLNPQLFIDISALIKKDDHTGIQRVVRSIMRQWLINPPENWRVQPVYATKYKGYKYAHRFSLRFLGVNKSLLKDVPINYKSGDIFFGLDFHTEVLLAQQSFYLLLKKEHIKTYFLVHDLIPITHPEYFPDALSKKFYLWLTAISHSNGLCCVSKTTAQILKKWILNNNPLLHNRPEISWFHLGADIKNPVPTTGFPLDLDLPRVLKQKKEPIFLLVGTIEPRKGHRQTLDAFELLWQEGLRAHLIFVGKEGWMMQSFVERLLAHVEYGKQLYWIADASDAYLQVLYETATCLIFPSEAEGFGLPLVEAANHDLPIIARDMPVFREIAGHFAYYFSGSKAEDLSEAIKQWILLYKKNCVISSSSMPRLTWEQSAKHLLLNILP